jgi:hypothetical protein
MAIKPAGTAGDRRKLRDSINAAKTKGDHAQAKELQEKARQTRRDSRVYRLFQRGYENSGLPAIHERKEKGRREAAQQAQAERDTQEAADAARAQGEKIDLYRKYLSTIQTKLINVPNKLTEIGEGFTLDDSFTKALKDLKTLPGFETLNLDGLQQRQKVLAGLLDELEKQVRAFLVEKYKDSPNPDGTASWQIKSIFQYDLDLPLDLNLNVRKTFTSLAPES